ncbi:MAG: geranylgeranyl reductase family protein [Candidatus Anstonellaceae archaeon]
MSHQYDAVIVGAGPAGSTCAYLLAKKGCKVLLLEKAVFPKDKPCGDAVGAKALAIAEQLGIRKQIASEGFRRYSGIVFSSPAGNQVEISLSEFENGGTGYVCKRKRFDEILFENAKKVCRVCEGSEVVDLIFDGTTVAGVIVKKGQKKEKITSKVVIGADGASSVVARKTGCLKYEFSHMCSAVRGYYENVKGLGKNIEVHFLRECMPGYFWIFPVSDTEANVGVGMLLSDIKAKKVNLWHVLDLCTKSTRFRGRFEEAKLKSELSGWMLPLASAKRKCAGEGFVLVGDAASLVDPFSGEGIGNAMRSAKIAAEKLGRLLADGIYQPSDCLEYEKALLTEMGDEIKYSHFMQNLGRHEWLLDLIIKKAQKSPRLRQELAEMIASREAKKKVADLGFYLHLLFG